MGRALTPRESFQDWLDHYVLSNGHEPFPTEIEAALIQHGLSSEITLFAPATEAGRPLASNLSAQAT